MATRNPDLAIAGEIRNMNFDQVRARVAAADPHTFYRKAAAFEQAAERLELFGALLRRYRAELESVWHNGDPRQFEWVDRMLRHVDALTAGLREPSYPAALRHMGDAVAHSQQRLRGLENHDATVPDQSAVLARDERARQVLVDLSTSYVQFGQTLAELPERSVTGVLIQAPAAPVEGVAAHPLMAPVGVGRGNSASTTATKSSRSAVSASPVDGGVPRSVAAEPFGRLSHFATSQPAPVKADQPVQFGGFATMALPAEGAVPLLASPAPAGDNARKHSSSKAEKPAALPASPLAGATAAPPATVSAEPARAAGTAHPVTVAGQPAATAGQPVMTAGQPVATAGHSVVPAVTSSAPAALQSTGVSPVITAAAAPAPAAAPPAHPNLASRPPLPGEFPAMSTSVGGAAAPLGDVHAGTSSTAAAASTGAVPPPAAVGAGSVAGAPVSRVDSTWLRADPGTWSASNAQGVAARPGHGAGGAGCATAGVIGHSENGKGEVR